MCRYRTAHGQEPSIRDLTVTGGYTRTDRTGEYGPDIPDCAPGYQKATALGGGIEVLPHPGGLPGGKVTISNNNQAAGELTSQADGGGIVDEANATLTLIGCSTHQGHSRINSLPRGIIRTDGVH